MIGLLTRRKEREYRIPGFLLISLLSNHQRFLLEGTGHIFSSQKIKEGIEYDFVIAEFGEPSEQISKENDFSERDCEFEEELFSEDRQWKYKLQLFQRLEAILKEEGLI